MRYLVMVILVLLIFANPVCAEEYEISVTQVGENLFWEPEQEVFIQTEYCFVDLGSAKVLLQANGYSGLLVISEKTRCDVKNFFGKTQLDPGKYSITVTREDENWYAIEGKSAALNTSDCRALIKSAPAELLIDENATAKLTFANETCQVKGIYSKIEVN